MQLKKFLFYFVLLCFTITGFSVDVDAKRKRRKRKKDKNRITLKFATIAPDGTQWSQQVNSYMGIIKKKNKEKGYKKLRIKIFMGGILGGESDLVRKCLAGKIDIIAVSPAPLMALIPELALIELPYLFNNLNEADQVLDTVLDAPFKKLFDKKGLILMSWAENGWLYLGFTNKKVKSLDDMVGLKIVAQEGPLDLITWKAYGANGIVVAVPEVTRALQTDIAQGVDGSAIMLVATSFYENIKYLPLTRHQYQPGAVLFSKKLWETKITKEQRELFLLHSKPQAAISRKGIRSMEPLLIKQMRDSDIEIYELPKKEIARFTKVSRGIHKKLVNEMGANGQKLYKQMMKKLKEIRGK